MISLVLKGERSIFLHYLALLTWPFCSIYFNIKLVPQYFFLLYLHCGKDQSKKCAFRSNKSYTSFYWYQVAKLTAFRVTTVPQYPVSQYINTSVFREIINQILLRNNMQSKELMLERTVRVVELCHLECAKVTIHNNM